MTKAEKLDALNAALAAAEQRIYARNFGVEASVPIIAWSGLALQWGKHSGRWQLCVRDVINEALGPVTPIQQARADARVHAAHALPALWRALEDAVDKDTADISRAIEAAQAFVRDGAKT